MIHTTKEIKNELTKTRRHRARHPHGRADPGVIGGPVGPGNKPLAASHRCAWSRRLPARLPGGLSLIAIVIGGLMFAFGEGGSKKALAGIVFGLGMAMGAANFLAWLF